MTEDDSVPVPSGSSVTLTPLDGVDLVAVTPRTRVGALPAAVRMVDETLADRIAAEIAVEVVGFVGGGPVGGTGSVWRTGGSRAQHPAETSSSVRAGRALDRLIARVRARTTPERS